MVTANVYPSDGGTPVTLTGDAVSFVNDESYGPARNFNIKDEERNGNDSVVLVNLSNVVAVTVSVS